MRSPLEPSGGGFTDLNCSGLIIVAIILAVLILAKEFKHIWPVIPDFLGNFVEMLHAAFSMDGYLVKCKLGDHAGNDHGKMKPPKVTHVEQDRKINKEKELEEARKQGLAMDPLDNYDDEKLMELEKARQREIEFKEKRKKDMRENNNRGGDNLEGFSDKKLNVNSKDKEMEVFNIDKNLFEFKEAESVCKYYNAELATYDQVKEAYDKGANWCNYGWIKTGQAVYPIQKDFYDNLSEEQKKNNHCGTGPGIVGGFMPSRSLRLGVNCYGKKPDADPDRLVSVDSNMDKFIDNEKNQIMNSIANKIYENKVDFKPFSNSQYSNYSKDKTRYLDSALSYKQDTTAADVEQKESNDIIQEEFTVKEKITGKKMVENFVFENNGMSEEFYRELKKN